MGLRDRNWKGDSDEYVYNMGVSAILRVICFILMIIAFAKHKSYDGCSKRDEITKYIISLMTIHLLVALLNILIMRKSMKGDMLDITELRKYMGVLLIFKMFLLIAEAIWCIIILNYIYIHSMTDCHDFPLVCISLVLVIFFALFVYHVVSFIFAFNLTNSEPSSSMKRFLRRNIAKLKGKEPSDFRYLSELLIDYFYNTNYQITDVFAGLILLREDQESRSMFKFNMLIPFEIDPGNADLMGKYIGYPEVIVKGRQPWMTLSNCLHFVKFAKLDKRFFKLSRIAIQTKLHINDFIYTDFKAKTSIFPFYVALDHKSKNIIVSVADNQTLQQSIKDILKGLDTVESEYASPALVHKDLLTKAKNIFILAFQSIENTRLKYPEYGLVTVGYGCGAGVASILALILKKHHPDVICYAFSPIGGIVNEELAYEMENFTLSVIFGDDIYPRLSLESFRNLKMHVKYLVYSSHVPKYKIFRDHFLKDLCIRRTKVSVQRMDDAAFANMLKKMWTSEVESKYFEGIVAALYVEQEQLYLPGKIIFCKRHKNLLLPYWAHRNYFKEILSTPNVFNHHSIYHIENWLKRIRNIEQKNYPSVFLN